MATILTVEQILALAPDAGAAKAGQGLAGKQKWVTLGCSEFAAWGECSGSAKDPYQAQIDLNGPAFKCSCPSRKFPCKHALGLYLLLASQPAAFTHSNPPAWVSAWLEHRAKREEKKASTETATAEKPPDPAAQEKRAAKRLEKVAHGIEELDLWLSDLVRNGLAAAPVTERRFWEGMAARMVDAQASGMARLLRRMATIPASGEGWQERLLEQLGQLYLLIDRFKRIENLPEDAQADIRALIGWTQNQEELLAQPGITDRWTVLGQRVVREDRLRVQRTWLWGEDSKRAALILHYAPGKDGFASLFIPGMQFTAEIVYYPGAYPLRALIKSRDAEQQQISSFAGYATVADAYKAYAGALVKYPWLEQFPLAVNHIYPVLRGDRWLLCDAGGQALPLAADSAFHWHLLAMSGGNPISVFGEWDGDTLFPLAATESDYCAFSCVEE